jgi:hypothetical protein
MTPTALIFLFSYLQDHQVLPALEGRCVLLYSPRHIEAVCSDIEMSKEDEEAITLSLCGFGFLNFEWEEDLPTPCRVGVGISGLSYSTSEQQKTVFEHVSPS